MFNSAALRTSSLTRRIVGDLQCNGRESCTSMGQPSSTGAQKYSIFTGRAWSIGMTHTTSAGNGHTGSTRLRGCRFGPCLLVTYGTDDVALAYRDWVLFEGGRFGSFRTASPTRRFHTISCYDSIACWGMDSDSFQRVGLDPGPT